mgnify:CR=1 FL=1
MPAPFLLTAPQHTRHDTPYVSINPSTSALLWYPLSSHSDRSLPSPIDFTNAVRVPPQPAAGAHLRGRGPTYRLYSCRKRPVTDTLS